MQRFPGVGHGCFLLRIILGNIAGSQTVLGEAVAFILSKM